MKELDEIGTLSTFDCPECHGPLWEISGEGPLRFRCRIGHAFGTETIIAAQSDEIERSLWRLVRIHEDRAQLTRRVAEKERRRNNLSLASELEARARDYQEDADTVRGIITRHGPPEEVATIDEDEIR